MSQITQSSTASFDEAGKKRFGRGCIDMLYKNALLILIILIVGGVLFALAQVAIYKIRPYERGLHLRGGRFSNVDQPGWHVQIPFVDTVVGVTVIERGGTIDKLAVMTLTMLQWMYRCFTRTGWKILCVFNLKC